MSLRPRAYYNENDPYCAQWLRNLVRAGRIMDGVVDDRSILDVRSEDLNGFTRCHFFAGIGGWDLALQLAEWPEDREVWTGSCPCQPFSTVGKCRGFADPRHLWPEWFRLIQKRSPPVVFGEQVANAKSWLDLVFFDLENVGYACGAANLPAVCKGAQHERQRLWFVADSNSPGWQNSGRFSAAQKEADFWSSLGVVHSSTVENIQGTFEPGSDWVVDGLSTAGLAVSAFGNAIVPQVGAEFIAAFLGAERDIAQLDKGSIFPLPSCV